MRKFWAKLLVVSLIVINMLPLTALGADKTSMPKEPYEKVAASYGSWYTASIPNGDANQMVVGYKGGFDDQSTGQDFIFSLSEEILLSGIYVPYYGSDGSTVELTLIGDDNNLYQGFEVYAEVYDEEVGNANYYFMPKDDFVLPKGSYVMHLEGSLLPEDAFLVKGYNLKAYEKYLKDLEMWMEGDKERPVNFTGTYRIWVNLKQTDNIYGPLDESRSLTIKNLDGIEISVLDKGSELELIGSYEGMPFSQRCIVKERDKSAIVAEFMLVADLTKLPYKAKISAYGPIELILHQGSVSLTIDGEALYSRAASEDKGADENTYALSVNGNRVKDTLPTFVMVAIGKVYGVGNIPGPDTPIEAAAGMLFPPLVGVIAHFVQEAIRAKADKGIERKLSVGEQAMKDANQSLGKGLYTEEEARAWATLGDALAGSGGDPEDAISIGDNEKPGGADYKSPVAESDYGIDPSEFDGDGNETDEDLSFGKPDVPEEKPDWPKEANEKTLPEVEAEPETMVLQTSAGGGQSIYVKDPKTGEWINPETGGVLDYEKYKNEVSKQLAEDKKINDAEFDKSSRAETAQDKINREEMKRIKGEQARKAYQEKMMTKYGYNSVDKVNDHLTEKAVKDRENFEEWQFIGDVNAVGEVGSTAVGAVADVGVDALSTVVPGGNYIKGAYKVGKGIAGTMADKGVDKASFWEGAVKGGADAALDLVNVKNPYANQGIKAVINVAGEGGGSALGEHLRGKDWKKAGAQGIVDGTYKTVTGAIFDGMTGDFDSIKVVGGPKSFVPNIKSAIMNKTSVKKIGLGLGDEFGTKPIVTTAVKNKLGIGD